MIDLKAIAKERKVRHVRIAEACGVSGAAVTHWLDRSTEIPDRHKLKLAEMLAVRLEDLLLLHRVSTASPFRNPNVAPPEITEVARVKGSVSPRTLMRRKDVGEP